MFLQQQLHQQGLPHTHPPGVSLPHPGLPPPHLPPGSSSGLLALSNALSQAPHLPVKDEKDRDRGEREREQRENSLRESPLPPRGAPSIYPRNTTDSHSSHGSDDGRSEEYNRKILGFDKRELGNSQSNIPSMKSGTGPNTSTPPNTKKKKDEKTESDHEKSDGELVVDDATEVPYFCFIL